MTVDRLVSRLRLEFFHSFFHLFWSSVPPDPVTSTPPFIPHIEERSLFDPIHKPRGKTTPQFDLKNLNARPGSSTFSTRIWTASSSCLAFASSTCAAAVGYHCAGCWPRWRRRTPLSGSSGSAPSTPCTRWRGCPRHIAGPPLTPPAAPCTWPARSEPLRPHVGPTGCPPGWRACAGSAVGSRGPISPWHSGRRRARPRWSRAGRRRRSCSRGDAACQTHPVRDRARSDTICVGQKRL